MLGVAGAVLWCYGCYGVVGVMGVDGRCREGVLDVFLEAEMVLLEWRAKTPRRLGDTGEGMEKG